MKNFYQWEILQINFHSQQHILPTHVHKIKASLKHENLLQLEVCSSSCVFYFLFLNTVSTFFSFTRKIKIEETKRKLFRKSQTKLIKKLFSFSLPQLVFWGWSEVDWN